MKKIILFILLIAGFSAKAQPDKFILNGTFGSNPPAKKIYIHLITMLDQTSTVNPVAIVNNKFLFKGLTDEPKQCILSWTETIPEDKSQYFSFLLDKGTITVTIPAQLTSAKVEGSKADTDFRAFFDLQKRLLPDFEKFNKDAEAAGKIIKDVDSLRARFEPRLLELQKKANEEQFLFVKNNPAAFISLLILPELAESSKDYARVAVLFSQLDTAVKSTPSAKIVYNHIDTEMKVSLGALAPEFTLNDANAKEFKLSSLRGKYVLLDFWASWCGPCRQENPNVVNTYQAFKDKGFTVLGVSLDNDRSDWLKAIKDDGLSWTQVSDLKFWNSVVAKLYGVHAIPRNFLLDPEGKIIARDLRGPELAEKLKDLFKSQ